jgi:hypothetical protein
MTTAIEVQPGRLEAAERIEPLDNISRLILAA